MADSVEDAIKNPGESISPSSDSSESSIAPAAAVTQPTKPQELVELEESCSEADNAKRSHERYILSTEFIFCCINSVFCRLISGLESDLKDLDAILSHVSGEHMIWLAHYDQCFSTVIREYTYEFCPFKQASQKSGSSTSLGRFSRFDSVDGNVVLNFENGQRCWQGMDRRAVVHTSCGLTSAISLVQEPSTCFYSFQFATPIACSLGIADAFRQEIDPSSINFDL